LRDYPELTNVGRLTLWQSLRCVNYSLWDEDAQRLISFRTLGAAAGRRRKRVSKAWTRTPVGKGQWRRA
jgi:hypothetical protein